MLGEDQPLLGGVDGVLQHLAQLLELGLAAGLDDRLGPRGQSVHDLDLALQVLDVGGDDRAEHGRLEVLVTLCRGAGRRRARAVVRHIFVGSMGVEIVGRVQAVEASSAAGHVRRSERAGAQGLGRLRQLGRPPLERAQQRPRRASQPPLKDAHCQADRAAPRRLAVDVAEVVGRGVVEGLLAVGAGREFVAEGVAGAGAVERATLQVPHLLLGAPEEVAAPLASREAPERFAGREDVGVQQPPQVMVGGVLPHVGRRGQQQEVAGGPAEAGVLGAWGRVPGVWRATGVRGRAAGQRLRQAVPPGLARAPVVCGGRQLVGLVEDDQVVGFDVGIAQRAEDAFARQRVDRDDRQVTRPSLERIAGRAARAGPGRRRHIRPSHDPERQAKERPQLPLPVADQPCRGRDQHATDPPSRKHVAHDQPSHDRLPRPRVVRKEEAERVLRQHVLVHRDPLVRQRVDPRDLAGKRRVELVSVLQPQRLGHDRHGVGVPREVKGRGCSRAVRATKRGLDGPRGIRRTSGLGRSGGLGRGDLLFQLAEPIQG